MRIDAGFELIEHTADVGLRAFGPNREAVFEQAALATVSLICDPATVKSRDDIPVVLTAERDDLLLAAWLNELIFLFETRHLVYRSFQVDEAGGGRLWARARGERHNPRRHDVRAQVKAATYHGLDLRRTDDGWEATVILDV
jgi:SHS2 domain-containing protein